MTPADIPFGLRLSLAAGWNQTAADWEMLLAHSRVGSFLACWEGLAAGTVTTVSYMAQLHWIGMALVDEAYRRRGIGRALLGAAIAAVEGQAAAWLDATPAGKMLYDTLGFQEVYRLGRWIRQPGPLRMDRNPICTQLLLENLPAVCRYDLPVFGADRSGVFAALQRNAPALAWWVGQGNTVSGYCLGRYGSRYTQIGPIAADDLAVARQLLLNALATCAQQQVIVDTTFHLPAWNRFLGELGFTEQRAFIRMRRGNFNLPEEHSRQLAIAGPELG